MFVFWIVCTLEPWYSEQVSQILFVHYIEEFDISYVIGLVNPQNGSWVLFTISRSSLYWGFVISRFECTYWHIENCGTKVQTFFSYISRLFAIKEEAMELYALKTLLMPIMMWVKVLMDFPQLKLLSNLLIFIC